MVAPDLCEDLAELAAAGDVAWRPHDVREADLTGAWLVHTATGDRALDAAVVAWAEARRLWCVVSGAAAAGSAGAGAAPSDRAPGPRNAVVGTARTPAVTRHGDVTVGVVSVGPDDPNRSAAVRDDLAALLRAGRGDLRRRDGTRGGSTPRTGAPRGHVTLVGGGPGDVDLLTLRGRRALAEADVVVADRLGPRAVLAELRPGVEVIEVGKTPGHHPVPQHEINRILVERAQRGQAVVRLKGGDPFVFGRGGEEVLACREAGVAVTVVPGVSSALAAPAAAGIPLTHRGVTTAFHVVSGHDGLDSAALVAVRDASATVVVLMGVTMLAAIADQALAAGADPATPVAIVENGSLPTQRVTRDRLDAIAARASEEGVRAPAVVVIGAVAAEHLLTSRETPTPDVR